MHYYEYPDNALCTFFEKKKKNLKDRPFDLRAQ